MNRAMKYKQSGMTFTGWSIVLAMAGMLGFVALKLFPVYMENFAVKKSLKAMSEQSAEQPMTPRVLRESFLRRLQVNNVQGVKAKDLKIQKDDGQLILSLNYEVRTHIIWNIDAILKFEELVLVN